MFNNDDEASEAMQTQASKWQVGEWLYCADTGHLCSQLAVAAKESSASAPYSLPFVDRTRPQCRDMQRLEPKVSAVFEYLLQRPGQVVSRQELLDAVWAETVVVEETLTRAISLLRSALSDQSPYQYIETFPKRGYRLIANATEFNQLPS